MKFETIGQAKRITGLSYLGSINSSSKIKKNAKVGVYTYVLYLAPHKESGYNVCPFSTPECRLGCLHNSGRKAMENIAGLQRIQNARVKKTKLFFEHKEFFLDWVVAEIKTYKRKAERDGFEFSVRLNGTSDLEIENIFWDVDNKNLLDIFPDVMFYDYTKNHNRLLKDLPLNYHLTLSYTGRNKMECLKALENGFNVAVVFRNKNLPTKFMGYPVVNGDNTDLRYLDPKNVIVGLSYKKHSNNEINEKILNSCFVVNA